MLSSSTNGSSRVESFSVTISSSGPTDTRSVRKSKAVSFPNRGPRHSSSLRTTRSTNASDPESTRNSTERCTVAFAPLTLGQPHHQTFSHSPEPYQSESSSSDSWLPDSLWDIEHEPIFHSIWSSAIQYPKKPPPETALPVLTEEELCALREAEDLALDELIREAEEQTRIQLEPEYIHHEFLPLQAYLGEVTHGYD